MARWWVPSGGGNGITHMASPRLIVKLHKAASQLILPNISYKDVKVNHKTRKILFFLFLFGPWL
jgi:hypothetical protein